MSPWDGHICPSVIPLWRLLWSLASSLVTRKTIFALRLPRELLMRNFVRLLYRWRGMLVVVLTLLIPVLFLMSAFIIPYLCFELEDASGWRAKRVLGKMWPDAVETNQVGSVSWEGESSRDSGSTFLRLECDSKTASQWAIHLRRDHRETSEWLATFPNHLVESRKHSYAGIPLREVTGKVPNWWTPPDHACEAHESMIWYQSSSSGVARGEYSIYDEANQTLWIYSYTCQHDELWPRGQINPTFGLLVPKLRLGNHSPEAPFRRMPNDDGLRATPAVSSRGSSHW